MIISREVARMGEAFDRYKAKHPDLEGVDLILALLNDLKENEGYNGTQGN